MKWFPICCLVFGVSMALGWVFDVAQRRAEADGANALPPCQDTNDDGLSDVADAISFLSWLFLGGPEPICPQRNGRPADLPDTGQTRCYDDNDFVIPCNSFDCIGQDGWYAAGCPSEGRFVDNGDDTVTDICTGLMWQKDTADINGDGQVTLESDRLNWCTALEYCEGLSFANHDDWRLPNVRELESIVDHKGLFPAIDLVFAVPLRPWSYWSSTSFLGPFSVVDVGPDFAWAVFFEVGEVSGAKRAIGHFVRAVRNGIGNALPHCKDVNGDGSRDISDAVFLLNWLFLGGSEPTCPNNEGGAAGLPSTGQTRCYDDAGTETPCNDAGCHGQDGWYAAGCPSEGRFVDNGDDTVTDICTGLMWQKDTADMNADGQLTELDAVSWCDALVNCENLNLAGHDDWRLPNLRELQSIVDYQRTDPAMDPVFGAPVAIFLRFTAGYWSSTSIPGLQGEGPVGAAWLVSFRSGNSNFNLKNRHELVRAVRNGP